MNQEPTLKAPNRIIYFFGVRCRVSIAWFQVSVFGRWLLVSGSLLLETGHWLAANSIAHSAEV
jgi:hypothetical protein